MKKKSVSTINDIILIFILGFLLQSEKYLYWITRRQKNFWFQGSLQTALNYIISKHPQIKTKTQKV